MRLICCVVLLLLLGGQVARAGQNRDLVTFAPAQIVALAPLARDADLALIESLPDGRLKQVTVFVWVAAPPRLVHDVVADLERYPEFVRNMVHCKVTKNADGTVDQEWAVQLTVSRFGGTHRHRFQGDGAIDVTAIDPGDAGAYRWEFHPAGGGTLLVQYGYVDVFHSTSFIRSVAAKAPPMEHGLALAAQLVQVRSAKLRSERLAPAGGKGARPPSGPARLSSLDSFLERGEVALIRSQPDGHLESVSLLMRVLARRSVVESAIIDGGRYAEFMDGITKSRALEQGKHKLVWRTTFSLPLITWDTRWEATRGERGGIDVVAVDGDLRGAYLRWDLTEKSGATVASLRTRVDLVGASLLLRALFAKEPLFEHGVSVAFGLVFVSGIEGRATGRIRREPDAPISKPPIDGASPASPARPIEARDRAGAP